MLSDLAGERVDVCMTIIAHSKRLIALDDLDDSQEVTTIDLRIPHRAQRSAMLAHAVTRRRDGTPRAEIQARLAQARDAARDAARIGA